MRPMFFCRKPTAIDIRALLIRQTAGGLSYDAVGATSAAPPAGYVVDRNRVQLGEGDATFLAAKAALEKWSHFDLGWVSAVPLDTPLHVGGLVGVAGRCMGIWCLMACRIVYLVNETKGAIVRWGFAYGTTSAHVETGEERFLIEWNRQDNSVFYDIVAFSKPNGSLARLGTPWLRVLQKRFARDSKAAMVKAVQSQKPT